MKKVAISIIIIFLVLIGLIINKDRIWRMVYLYNQHRAIKQIPQDIRIVIDALINYEPSKNSYQNENIQELVNIVNTQLVDRLNEVRHKDILNITSITPELSHSFISYREKHQGFNRLGQLKQIKGMDLLDIYDIITAVMMAYVTREMGQIMNSAEELSEATTYGTLLKRK